MQEYLHDHESSGAEIFPNHHLGLRIKMMVEYYTSQAGILTVQKFMEERHTSVKEGRVF